MIVPKFRLRLATGAAALLVLLWGMPTLGATVRVFPGDDLQYAIDSASENATLMLMPGDYRGPVVVSRPITLRANAGARIVGNGEGSVVTLQADGIRLEGIEIVGSGRNLSRDDAGVMVLGDDANITNVRLRDNLHGIYVRQAKNVELTDNDIQGLAATGDTSNVIGAEQARRADGVHHAPPGTRSLMGNGLHLFNANNARVVGNRIHHARDGIYVAHTRGAVFQANRIHESRYGIHYMYSSDNVIKANELWGNVAGPALMFSRNLEVVDNVMRDHSGLRAYGLLLQDIDASVIRGNEIRGNRVGMRLQHSSSNEFRNNRLFGNLAGATINSSSRDNILTRNSFGLNMRQIELTGPPPPTQWSFDGRGNRWYGSLPLDLTGDGVSQLPHHEVDLMAERREEFPHAQLLTGSIGIRVIEWALSRAPLPATRYITDPHPLARKPSDDRGP